jgi:hypothetical protein
MRITTFLSLLFIFYCAEAGVLLLFVAWYPVWDRTVMQLPFPMLPGLMIHPLFRGAVSGFGLVHLVWGAHDLHVLLSRKERAGVQP